MFRSLLSILFIINFYLFSSVVAIEKDQLLVFFKEYDASLEKKKWGWDRLAYAIEKGYIDIAEFLVLSGDKIGIYDESWPQPLIKDVYFYYKHHLITAIRKNHKHLSILLISSIDDVSKVEEYKDIYIPVQRKNEKIECKNAMYVAIAECQQSNEIVRALLEAGDDINKSHSYFAYPQQQFNGFCIATAPLTPLKLAIILKKLDIAELLLNCGADVDILSGHYKTALAFAVEDNYIDGVKLLLKHGADPLKVCGNDSILQIAMQKEYWDIVNLLLDASIK